eukprot:TRINITY_DN2379_c0_g1_i2.p1 TRINITY_DN2379_c0_g1~~TRINITY_DN2379_c0_g1_i2.p1  ORF type:complete len:449 (-),score=75.18 TRINITY_DN2379_c0_g1_i2:204-1415(-)
MNDNVPARRIIWGQVFLGASLGVSIVSLTMLAHAMRRDDALQEKAQSVLHVRPEELESTRAVEALERNGLREGSYVAVAGTVTEAPLYRMTYVDEKDSTKHAVQCVQYCETRVSNMGEGRTVHTPLVCTDHDLMLKGDDGSSSVLVKGDSTLVCISGRQYTREPEALTWVQRFFDLYDPIRLDVIKPGRVAAVGVVKYTNGRRVTIEAPPIDDLQGGFVQVPGGDTRAAVDALCTQQRLRLILPSQQRAAAWFLGALASAMIGTYMMDTQNAPQSAMFEEYVITRHPLSLGFSYVKQRVDIRKVLPHRENNQLTLVRLTASEALDLVDRLNVVASTMRCVSAVDTGVAVELQFAQFYQPSFSSVLKAAVRNLPRILQVASYIALFSSFVCWTVCESRVVKMQD